MSAMERLYAFKFIFLMIHLLVSLFAYEVKVADSSTSGQEHNGQYRNLRREGLERIFLCGLLVNKTDQESRSFWRFLGPSSWWSFC